MRRCETMRMGRCACGGFTLVELLLALGVSGLIGLGVVLMLSGAGVATQQQRAGRDATVSRQVVMARLSTLTRAAAMVLAVEDDAMVLWMGDVNGNGKPELSELRRLTWNSVTGEVHQYQAPAGLDEDEDFTHELTADFDAVTRGLEGDAAFVGELVVRQVTQWSLTLDKAQVRQARLLRLDVTYRHDGREDQAVIISALRASGV